MPSALFEQMRASQSAVAVWTVHLKFPAFEALPEKNFYWSTVRDLNDDQGHTYTHALNDDQVRGRHQRHRGNDYAEFAVANARNEMYQAILPYEDLIERGQVIVRECYEVTRDYFESEIKFVGYLKSLDLIDQDHTLKFTANSDMSRTGFIVGGRILTRERCGTEFNFNGLNDPLIHPCGWTTPQGGNPLFCSKLLDGPDGCGSHNNKHRFYAVEALATATIEVLNPSDMGETGFEYESGPCFTDRMFMLMDFDMNVLPMDKVRLGFSHVGFDVFNKDVLIQSKILRASRHPTDHYWEATFDRATIETAHNHLFYLGSRLFAPVAALGDRPVCGIYSTEKASTSVLVSLQRLLKNDWFYEFRTESSNYIVCDADKKFFYFVHNAKPRTPGDIYS